jgi:hypothetical protein
MRGGALVLNPGTTAGRWNRRDQLDIADGPHHNPGKTHPHDPDVDGDIPKNQAVVELDVETWEVSRRCAAREYTRTSVRPSRAGSGYSPYPPLPLPLPSSKVLDALAQVTTSYLTGDATRGTAS